MTFKQHHSGSMIQYVQPMNPKVIWLQQWFWQLWWWLLFGLPGVNIQPRWHLWWWQWWCGTTTVRSLFTKASIPSCFWGSVQWKHVRVCNKWNVHDSDKNRFEGTSLWMPVFHASQVAGKGLQGFLAPSKGGAGLVAVDPSIGIWKRIKTQMVHCRSGVGSNILFKNNWYLCSLKLIFFVMILC